MKAGKVYEMFPYSVQFRFTENGWKTYKELCNEKSESPHGNLRKYIKKYIKKNEKGL